MLRHRAVRNFFSPRSGDNEEETESATWILNSRSERATPIQEEDEVEQISQPFNGLSVHDPDNRLSDGSRYEDDGAAGNRGSDGRTVGSGYGRNIKSPPPTHDGERIDSVNPRSDSPFTSSATARTQSPFPTNRASSSSSRNYSAEAQWLVQLPPVPGMTTSRLSPIMGNGDNLTKVHDRSLRTHPNFLLQIR